MKFHMVIAISLNLKFWNYKKKFGQLQAHAKLSLLLCNGGQIMTHFSVFYASCKIDWQWPFFSRRPLRKKLWYLSTTYENFIKSEKLLINKIVWRFRNWKVKIFTTSLIKSWSYQFLSLIDLKSIKKFINCIRQSRPDIFGLEGQEGCKVAAYILHGFDCSKRHSLKAFIFRTNLPDVLSLFPQSSSVKTLDHLAQLVMNPHQDFVRYDYGEFKNNQTYKQPFPPAYDLTLVTAPTAIIHGDQDGIASMEDVDKLAKKLPNVIHKEMIRADHFDFIIAQDAADTFFQKVYDILKGWPGWFSTSLDYSISTGLVYLWFTT